MGDALLQQPRVALFVPPYRVGRAMGGIGVRVWELAEVLARRVPVTIVAKGEVDLHADGVSAVPAKAWREALDACSAAVFYDLPDTRIMLAAHRAGKLVITDNGPPIEHLEFHRIRHAADPDAAHADLVARFRLQVAVSDHFIVRSEVARATLVASLALVGRLSYANYDRSARLEHLMSWIPIGFNRTSEARAERAPASLPIVDFVWSGGIWDFYDPVVLVEAVARLARAGKPVSIRFMYPPPAQQTLHEAAALEAAIRARELGSLIHLAQGSVAHDERDPIVKSARGSVLIAKDGIENYTAIRLRLRDSMLYRLPMVIDRHGATGDLVRALGIGVTVDGRDPDDVAAGLAAVRYDDALRGRLTANLELARTAFRIEPHADKLADFILRSEHAPDHGTERHARQISALLVEHPDLLEHPCYPY
jgi:glycosyltransferase involved in cell wall biosynthesis